MSWFDEEPLHASTSYLVILSASEGSQLMGRRRDPSPAGLGWHSKNNERRSQAIPWSLPRQSAQSIRKCRTCIIGMRSSRPNARAAAIASPIVRNPAL